jgi:peptide-methionine (S)-S-oxide reductase
MTRKNARERLPYLFLGAVVLFIGGRVLASATASPAVVLPAATADAALTRPGATETAVFAGGCFWGIEAVFEHLKGVKSAESGYSGGTTVNPSYEEVSSGMTGHAEPVRVVYDPSQITYGTLLRVFFSVAHDPTQLNYQGPDHGTQYRSAIFYANPEQKRLAEAYIAQLTNAKAFPRPIVTQVIPLKTFYPAEAYHQDYMVHHPYQPYIVYNDAPKVAHLKQQFPELYRGE